MLIWGRQKTTLLDYPWKVATMIFTVGCNMRCRFCHNPEFVLPAKKGEQPYEKISEEAFFLFLQKRKGLLDGVVICGGEPTVQPDLRTFCEKIKKQGLLVKLDTNGTNPALLRSLIDDGLVDYVAMDIKTDYTQRYQLLQISKLYGNYCESISLLLERKVDYEFRTTMIKNYHTPERFQHMLQRIAGAKNYYLQAYRPQKTLDPRFDGEQFTRDELEEYRQIAATYVGRCEVRG